MYQERRALALSLSDTKSAVSKLHRIIDVILAVVVIVICLLILDVATTQLLVFVSSQVLILVFIFGNTLKNVFEAIVFVFVFHPFDVGDRCVIDGVVVRKLTLNLNVLLTLLLPSCSAMITFQYCFGICNIL